MSKSQEITAPRLWLILARCYRAVADHARRNVQAQGLGLGDFAVLEALLHKGPLTVSEIGAKVLLTSGSMTAAVDRLQAKSLLKRKTDASDGRVCHVALTAPGRKLIKRVFAAHELAIEEAISGITQPERAQLHWLLKKLGLTAQQKFQQQHRTTEVKNEKAKKG